MLTTRKQRAYPTPTQVDVLDGWDAPLRAVHNAALEERKNNYLAFKRWGTPQEFISYESQAAQLTQIRAELDWVRAVPAAVTQQMLRTLHEDCQKHGSMRMKYWEKRRHEP
jgi:putative transposase